MTKTAPIVTSAVESHSTPMSNHTGRGLCIVAVGKSLQDCNSGSARAQRVGRPLDRGDLALELVAIFGSEQTGVIHFDLAPMIGIEDLVNNGATFRTVERKVGASNGHDTCLCWFVYS